MPEKLAATAIATSLSAKKKQVIITGSMSCQFQKMMWQTNKIPWHMLVSIFAMSVPWNLALFL